MAGDDFEIAGKFFPSTFLCAVVSVPRTTDDDGRVKPDINQLCGTLNRGCVVSQFVSSSDFRGKREEQQLELATACRQTAAGELQAGCMLRGMHGTPSLAAVMQR